MALHGWVGAEDEILNAYAASCLKASEDDEFFAKFKNCLLYTSPSPRDLSTSRMPSSA